MEHKPLFDRIFRQRRYENAHFNFTNLFMWRKPYQIQWTMEDDFLLMKASWEGEHFALPPFGAEAEKFPVMVERLQHYFAENNWAFSMRGLTKEMTETLQTYRPEKYTYDADRDNFDYVYQVQDLIELKGRKYHGKKNHINAFLRLYPEYQYTAMTPDVIPLCLQSLDNWCLKRNCKEDIMLWHEKQAIVDALNHFFELGLTGGAIQIDGRVEAFTFGEMLNEDTAVIHVEKADADIRGIYPTINWEFCRNAWANINYVNREEDMGIEGLRKAKESYYPSQLIEKYVVLAR